VCLSKRFEYLIFFKMAGGSTLRGLYALLVALSLLSAFCVADAVTDLQTKGRAAVDAEVAKSTTCTKDKLKVRKEWYVVSPSKHFNVTD
jgi:tyrosinase